MLCALTAQGSPIRLKSAFAPLRGMNSALRPSTQFHFGQNWEDYSRKSLDLEKVRQAKSDFERLFSGIPLENRSFLDIGFGQGLSLPSAASNGARCLGVDINARCLQVLGENRKAFFLRFRTNRSGELRDRSLIRN